MLTPHVALHSDQLPKSDQFPLTENTVRSCWMIVLGNYATYKNTYVTGKPSWVVFLTLVDLNGLEFYTQYDSRVLIYNQISHWCKM